MKSLMLVITFLSCIHVYAQKTDTIYFSKNWKTIAKDSASYYRVISPKLKGSYKVNDYFINGKIQMSGQFTSLNPEVKDGTFIYWLDNGEKTQEVIYKKNKIVNFFQFAQKSENVKKEDKFVFSALDSPPKFNGLNGESVYEFISKNLEYPRIAFKKKITGRVVASFIIDKDGKVIEPEIISSPDQSLSDETIRLLQLMPNWTPGYLNNKPVKVKYSVPISFSL